jgi:general secretion pathway protein G
MKLWGQRTRLKSGTQSGFTLTELLLVLVIVATLLLLLLWYMTTQLSRSRDARRKADLEKIKVSFEDYYNDKGCYPPPTVLQDCNSQSFQPYLQSIPCDPTRKTPYLYVPLEGNECKGYRVYTGLEDVQDPIVGELGCDEADGCGYGPAYNYGIAVGVPVRDEDGTYVPPAATPVPTPATPNPSAPIFVYACDTAGVCNQYEAGHPALQSCPVTFPQSNCNNQCGNGANWCSG